MAESKFRDALSGFMYDMFRAAGMTMVPGNFPERVRQIGASMAQSIELAAERKSIEVIKRLQEATLKGFEGMEKELDALKALVLKQNEVIETLLNKKGE